MLKRVIMGAGCILGVACGGGNAAQNHHFNYGPSQQATSSQAGAMDGPLSTATAQRSALSANDAPGLGDTASATGALLGSSGAFRVGQLGTAGAKIAAAQSALHAAYGASGAASSGGFDNPGCVSTTQDSVTLNSCTATVTDSAGTTKASANGYVKRSGDTLSWDLSESFSFNGTTSQGAASLTAKAHQSGTLTVTSSTVKGTMLSEATVSGTQNGQAQSLGVDESLNIDVTFSGSPACVTAGTLEAKRVWTARPTGVTAANLPDAAAKVTWTGCHQATVQLSIN